MNKFLSGSHPGEKDALESLRESMQAVAQASPPVGRVEGQAEIAARALTIPGISFTGKSPNILSKEARYRLVNFLLWTAGLIFLVIIGSTVLMAWRTKAEIPSTWVWILGVSVIVALFLCVLAYFTVMGFGEVSLSLSSETADSGETDGSAPGTGGDAPPVTTTPAPEK